MSSGSSSIRRLIAKPTNAILVLLCTIVLLAKVGTIARSDVEGGGSSSSASGGGGGVGEPSKGAGAQTLPLHSAIKSQNVDAVRSLLKSPSVDVNSEDEKGLTPLIEATLTGNLQLVEMVMAAGAPAQPKPGFRHTPLRAACLTGNAELIRLLLRKGADPNAQSDGGRTPLMGACFLRPGYAAGKSLPAVSAMLDDGRTDIRISNSFGETALDLCRQRGYGESVKLLEMMVKRRGMPVAQQTRERMTSRKWHEQP